MSEIVTRIVDSLGNRASGVGVEDVRIGLGYTAVLLEDGSGGVAYTFREEAQGGCSVFHALRPIAGRPASDLLALLESEDPIEAAVGLACANAFTNRHGAGLVKGDILAGLDVGADDHVGMVGHFAPLVGRLEERAGSLTIFERIEKPEGRLRPVSEAGSVLPSCQLALVTATSIINHTIDGLLDAAGQCRQVVVLGASTPMSPEAFAGTGVSMLSGVVVAEPAEVLRVVSEGGGMRLFKPHVQKVNLSLRSP